MFYCIFDQIIAAMVNIRDFFQKLKNKIWPQHFKQYLKFLIKSGGCHIKGLQDLLIDIASQKQVVFGKVNIYACECKIMSRV